MLPRDGHRTRDRHRERALHPDRAIQNAVDPPQNCAAERGQAVLENLVDGLALVDAANPHRFPIVVMHQYDSRIA
jgi:hypothetical protein